MFDVLLFREVNSLVPAATTMTMMTTTTCHHQAGFGNCTCSLFLSTDFNKIACTTTFLLLSLRDNS